MFGIFQRRATPPRRAQIQASQRRSACKAEASEKFARDLVSWLRAQGAEPVMDWHSVVRSAYVFAETTGRPKLSAMALAKAFRRLGIKRHWSYLPVGDHRFRNKRDLGQRRPRLLMVHLPTVDEEHQQK